MKKILWAGALMLTWLMTADRASASGFGPFCLPPYKIEAGANVYFRLSSPGDMMGGAQAGPWYNYWPLEAHFQPPPPHPFPYWPQPMSLPPGFTPPYPKPEPGRPTLPPPMAPANGVVPSSYTVPSYWYGR